MREVRLIKQPSYKALAQKLIDNNETQEETEGKEQQDANNDKDDATMMDVVQGK